jgi:uncharacterized protein HemX
MKNALIRLLAFLTLATSLSAFAASGKPKGQESTSTSAPQQQSGCTGTADQGKMQNSQNNSDSKKEQEEEFDRVLMGIYG